MIRGLIAYLKGRLRHDRLYRSPSKRGLWGFLKRSVCPPKIRTVPEKSTNLFLNRYCNLNCFSCAALGMNPPSDETTVEEVHAFLDNIDGYKPGTTFCLTGGEPTAMDPDKLEEICDLIHYYGYKTTLLTNGFKLIPHEWIDYITLDKHGPNDEDIAKWEKYLKEMNREYDTRDKQWHMDIPYSIENNITKGARCSNWISSLSVWKDVVYPCCNIMCVAWWDNDLDVHLAKSLRDSGWSVYNPDLKATILNWRETLPGEAYRICTLKCWKDASKTEWVKIT